MTQKRGVIADWLVSQFRVKLQRSPSFPRNQVGLVSPPDQDEATNQCSAGAVFEKRLIEKYIAENGKDPVSGEELDPEDLLPIKSARIVRPRPPTLTSIPALLAQFQNEWDSLAIETYNLREQLARTREELATALYQHDAAVRVIARLTKERDEARDALSKITISGSTAANGDAMAVDNDTLPDYLAEHVDQTQEKYTPHLVYLSSFVMSISLTCGKFRLSKSRKKRPVPEGWASPEDISSLQQLQATNVSVPESTSLAVEGEHAAIGGKGGEVAIYSLESGKVEASLKVGAAVTDTIWTGDKIVLGTVKGQVRVYSNGSELATFAEHAGPVAGLALHPGGLILASVGPDKAFVFYDLDALRTVFRRFTDSCKSSPLYERVACLVAKSDYSSEHLCIPSRRPPLRRWLSGWQHQGVFHQDRRVHGRLQPWLTGLITRVLGERLLVRRSKQQLAQYHYL